MKRHVLWLLLVALIAAAIGRWSAPAVRETAPALAPAPSVAVTARADAASALAEVAQSPPAAPSAARASTSFLPPEAPAAGARGLGFDPSDFLGGLPQQLDQISDRARTGDAAALGELADWLDYCKLAERAVRVGSVSTRSANPNYDGFKDASVLQYFKQVGLICGAWSKRHPWLLAEAALVNETNRELYEQQRAGTFDPKGPMPRSFPDVMRRRAAESGDLLSRSRDNAQLPCARPAETTIRDQQIARYREYSACVYQARLDLLRRLLGSHDPRAIAVVPLQIGYGFGASQFLTQDPLFNEALWQLVACSFGQDCGPAGPYLRTACANGVCGYGHVRDFLADQRMTPAAMRRIDFALPGLISAIQSTNLEAILGPPPPP
jgi:hypothetical protein